jgi:Ca2+-binding EF-hand superfamily protein
MARLLLILAGLIWPLAAAAEETALQKAIQKDPDRFAGRVDDLIAGFGGPDGLRTQGIEEHIALERAGARASALRRFHAMDLDSDGTVNRDELRSSQRAANAEGRGRLERQFLAADIDADGRVDQAELAEQGRIAALRALGEDEADFLRGLMDLDDDGNGALTAAEVDRAVAGLEKAG